MFHFETKCTRMTNFRNRIKALEYVNAADLTPHPGNWREHGKAQADARSLPDRPEIRPVGSEVQS